jgi:hypothetical protein
MGGSGDDAVSVEWYRKIVVVDRSTVNKLTDLGWFAISTKVAATWRSAAPCADELLQDSRNT